MEEFSLEEFEIMINKFQEIFDALIENYGKVGSELILNYLLHTESNKFSSVKELYDAVTDKYISLVNTVDAKTLEELEKEFPNEEMFKFFRMAIDKVS
jgi:hypothetical protein